VIFLQVLTDILSMNPAEITTLMSELCQPKYRAMQIFEWLHCKNVKSFAEMDNLPKSLRNELDNHCFITTQSVVKKQTSGDGTEKFLMSFATEGATRPVYAESVLMSYKHGTSVCISTQAGCKMGCKFCASASGFERSLTAGEYCAQVYNAQKVKNIVLMGCGEPLDNFDATIRFIELITHEQGKNIGQRHITISTCGLIPQIYALAEKQLQINLAISLHAPNDEVRQELMPVAKANPLHELIKACRFYIEKTHRRITFEYALSRGINDGAFNAKALAKLLQNLLCHVNLIPINEVNKEFAPTPRRDIEIFADVLQKNNIRATIRRSLGGDINAACGQLLGLFENFSVI